MTVGPEATVVAKAAGSVLKKVSDHTSGTPTWPNMHEALLELHEILSDWCEAARRTGEALGHLRSRHLTRVTVEREGGTSNSGVPTRMWTMLGIPVKPGYIESARRDIDAVMSPAAPLTQRWSVTKRRQAARRSLRGLMRIYCADLLEEFEAAVEARSRWVTDHRHKIDRALKQGIDADELDRLIRETARSTSRLDAVREKLKRLIQERYPMGSPAGQSG
ncbi:hypothetical protein O7599_22020 [Streptomyces sp. WMMC500]|uniref:hypothetical protein n=1 Tax=Streptomyces sp. WMMC500 TaxID=3015154 RepID=UPI00248AE5B5|nr:hypothetical protein [Streptomyces sp. WMMC500]WBB58312.1 hypothetical protein O7599_22020 [Streptomyces sp. WMMC500]